MARDRSDEGAPIEGSNPGFTELPEPSCATTAALRPAPVLCGSGRCFSGYGGLDFAVEHVLGAETGWFSEINEPVAQVFEHHWNEAPNLGDVTAIDLEPGIAGGHPLWGLPLSGRLDRRQTRRARPRRSQRSEMVFSRLQAAATSVSPL